MHGKFKRLVWGQTVLRQQHQDVELLTELEFQKLPSAAGDLVAPESRVRTGEAWIRMHFCSNPSQRHLTCGRWGVGGRTPSTEAPASVQGGQSYNGNSRPTFRAPCASCWTILQGMSHLGLHLGVPLLKCQHGADTLIQLVFPQKNSVRCWERKGRQTKILTSGRSVKSAPTLA